jgi:hypothetical protein
LPHFEGKHDFEHFPKVFIPMNSIDLTNEASGRMTGQALDYFLKNLEGTGRRSELPLVLILLTNGRTAEDRFQLMLTGWQIQAEAWCNAYGMTETFAIL